MLAKVLSAAVSGVEGYIVQVEVDLVNGLPFFSIVGLPKAAVRESKERVRAAIKNSGYKYLIGRVTVNLAPAAVQKEGAGYDLPIALGMLAASGLLASCPDLDNQCAVGELSLDGSIRPVNGILPMVLAAKEMKVKRFLVPMANAEEAGVVDGVEIAAVNRLDEAVELLIGRRSFEPVSVNVEAIFKERSEYSVDFNEVKGQEHVKRAVEVAAAGGHNILLSGVPGTGKTMIARRLPTILPDLSIEEALETTKIYSSTGLLPENMPLVVTRPFRSPHHTISDAGLIGGGLIPRPGEVSLAHNGVLFLDELPEFKKNVLEVMRQPLEDGVVTIARAASTMRFPANFMLVAAMNPCPCGYLGDNRKECVCSPNSIQRYRGRLSGPLLDRIDMHVEVPPVPVTDMTETTLSTIDSATIRHRVNRARKVQRQRFSRAKHVYCNAQMSPAHLKKHCRLDRDSAKLLQQSIVQLDLSARAHNRILKIARTIADLDSCENINTSHVAEAVQYRRMRHGRELS